MYEDLCFEDIKRQQIPIPESIVRDVKEVERLLNMEYISKEQAEKYLEKIEEDFRKLQGENTQDE